MFDSGGINVPPIRCINSFLTLSARTGIAKNFGEKWRYRNPWRTNDEISNSLYNRNTCRHGCNHELTQGSLDPIPNAECRNCSSTERDLAKDARRDSKNSIKKRKSVNQGQD